VRAHEVCNLLRRPDATCGNCFQKPTLINRLDTRYPFLTTKLTGHSETISWRRPTLTWMLDAFAAVGIGFAVLIGREQRRRLLVPVVVSFLLLTGITIGVRVSGHATRLVNLMSQRASILSFWMIWA
jgi:hypothetical protein